MDGRDRLKRGEAAASVTTTSSFRSQECEGGEGRARCGGERANDEHRGKKREICLSDNLFLIPAFVLLGDKNRGTLHHNDEFQAEP